MKLMTSFLDENWALVKRSLYQMYQQAVNHAPYSFIYMNTNVQDVNKMLYFKVSDD